MTDKCKNCGHEVSEVYLRDGHTHWLHVLADKKRFFYNFECGCGCIHPEPEKEVLE
jgi:hypothetical protein